MTISDYDNVKHDRISREELYDLVWTKRLADLSKKYYISQNGLIKKCNEWNIPLPNLKYWIQFKDSSNPPTKTPLPKFSGYSSDYFKLRDDYEGIRDSIQKELQRIRKEIEEDKNIKLIVSEKLTNPDPLIAATRDALYKKEIYPNNQGVIYHHQGTLGIYVSPALIARALRFMDTLIKALRNRGHQFINVNGNTHVVVQGEDYWLSCKEKEKRVIVKGNYYESTILEPTGLLSFRLGESYKLKEWTDGKIPIEKQLVKIIAGIEFIGLRDEQERIKREKQWAIREEEEKKAKALQERREKELTEFKKLFKVSKRHEEAQVIRRYIDELEKSAIQRNTIDDELKNYIEWARKKADWYDPFIEAKDDLLSAYYRENLYK